MGLLVCAAAAAEEPASSLLADMCAACHGPGGESPGSIPSLAALDAEAMRAFLIGFREGDIDATVMDRIARALTDSEIDSLARHFQGASE